MTGWKTWVAGIAAITYGVFGMVSGTLDQPGGWEFIVQGLAIIGLGHKIEKTGR